MALIDCSTVWSSSMPSGSTCMTMDGPSGRCTRTDRRARRSPSEEMTITPTSTTTTPTRAAQSFIRGSERLRDLLHHLGVETEQLGGFAAQDIALGLLLQERQIVNGRRQVEIPVRIVGGPNELGLGVDHLESRLENREIV